MIFSLSPGQLGFTSPSLGLLAMFLYQVECRQYLHTLAIELEIRSLGAAASFARAEVHLVTLTSRAAITFLGGLVETKCLARFTAFSLAAR